MAESPKLSINVPTLNAARTLRACLESIARQTLPPRETIVVDCGSGDDTASIAQEFDEVRLISAPGLRLVGQRHLAARESTGEFCLFLDADQVLADDTIQRLTDLAPDYDMMVLGERSYNPRRLLEHLADIDRRLVHSELSRQIEPRQGMLLPRLFRRSLLLRAFRHLPADLESQPNNWDHLLLFYEASKISRAWGFLPNAVYHMDRGGWLQFLRHYYSYGRNLGHLRLDDEHMRLIRGVVRSRSPMLRRDLDFRDRIASSIYLGLKAVPHTLGYLIG